MKQKESLIGQTFVGRYDVTAFLGEGEMGRIYLANDRQLGGREVALKVLHQHLGGDKEVMSRFNREMQATEQVVHPNSVQFYDHGMFDDRLYIAMEYVDGESLGEVVLEAGKLPWQRAANLGRQIASALAVAHKAGVVHRDLKPDNVMIKDPGGADVVKVCDFGLARFVDDEENGGAADDDGASDFKTAIGVRVGTPHYMAPEYILSFRADHRADLYALGVLVYEMLTGKPPHDGAAYEVLDRAVRETAKPPSKLVPGIPSWLDQAVGRLLERDPEKRVQTAEEAWRLLGGDRDVDDPTQEATDRGVTRPPAKARSEKASAKKAGGKGVVAVTVLILGGGVVLGLFVAAVLAIWWSVG